MMGIRPAARCGSGRTRLLPILVVAALFTSACGDSTGVWPRYRLERAYYQAQQQLNRADLQGQSGEAADLKLLHDAFTGVVTLYTDVAAGAASNDTVLHLIGAQARLRLADVLVADSEWRQAALEYQNVASGPSFPIQFKHMALMGLGRMEERLGNHVTAAMEYRRLLTSFNPPVGDGGVNREVLALPRRMINIARDHAADSVTSWRNSAVHYYDSLASAYPYTELGMAALGELGMVHAQDQKWELVVQTLLRATDTSGAIMPPYWIDIGEVTADQLGDTARALEIYAQVATTFAESPFRVDADLKRAQIHMRRGEFAVARNLLAALKESFEDRPAVILPAQLLFAAAIEAEGNWERAKNEYLFLITTYPQSIEAVQAALAVAHHFVRTEETGRVAEWYNRADELASALARPDKFSPAMAGRAMDLRVTVAAEQKRWDDVVARLNDIVNTFSDRSGAGAEALFKIGLLNLRERADTAAAASAWRRLMSAQPSHPQLQLLRDEMNKWPSTYNQDFES